MSGIEISAFVRLPIQNLLPSTYTDIINMLTFSYRDYYTGEKFTVNFYKTSNKYLYVPRFLFNYLDIELPEKYIEYNFISGQDIDIDDNIKYRNDIQKEATNSLLNNDNGILKLPPGKGKTVIALKYISTIKKKTVIYVDSDKLRTQWMDRIIEHTTLRKENIGIIQGDKWELEKPIIIAMIQTVSNRVDKIGFLEILERFKKADIGCTIFDEVHTAIGPEKFTNCAFASPSKKIFGLTATPFRTDNRDKILNYCIGDIIYSSNEYDIIPKVNVVHIDTGISRTKSHKYITWSGDFDRNRYLKILKKNDIYWKTIEEILKACKEKDRNVVLIAGPKFILETAIDKFSELLGPENVGYFVGGSEDSEKDKQYTFTTYKMTGKAIDQPKWDTLIFLTPVASPIVIEQTIGRITRKYESKKSSVIFDIVDTCYPKLVDWYKQRELLYNQLDIKINKV